MAEFDDEAKFACERLDGALEDFTSLGRWGWALAIGFLGQIILQSAGAGGDLFPDIRCEKAWELAGPFLAVVVIASAIYGYFVVRSRSAVVRVHSYALAVSRRHPHPALTFALDSVPSRALLCVMVGLRLALIPFLLGTWVLLFDLNDKWLGEPMKCPAKWEERHRPNAVMMYPGR